MDLSLLATLKEKLQTARQLSDVCSYFFDHFGDKPEFMQLGEGTRDADLEQLLQHIAAQLAGGPAVLVATRLVRLAEHNFIHGGVQINEKLGNVIYFEDLHMGLLTVCWDPPDTRYVRFRAQPVRPAPTPSIN